MVHGSRSSGAASRIDELLGETASAQPQQVSGERGKSKGGKRAAAKAANAAVIEAIDSLNNRLSGTSWSINEGKVFSRYSRTDREDLAEAIGMCGEHRQFSSPEWQEITGNFTGGYKGIVPIDYLRDNTGVWSDESLYDTFYKFVDHFL